jgi:hypothetical protein
VQVTIAEITHTKDGAVHVPGIKDKTIILPRSEQDAFPRRAMPKNSFIAQAASSFSGLFFSFHIKM